MDWHMIGVVLAIDHGLAMDWQRIEDGLASDGCLWVGRTELADVGIVLRRDTSVGPYSTLVPRPSAQVASDWYDVVTIRANPSSIHFL